VDNIHSWVDFKRRSSNRPRTMNPH
jgi:hypothetical protein